MYGKNKLKIINLYEIYKIYHYFTGDIFYWLKNYIISVGTNERKHFLKNIICIV